MHRVKCLIALLVVLLIPLTLGATGGKTELSPSAFLPEDRFEFETVVDGVQIRHSFVIENRGSAPLNIHKVKTG